MTLKLQTPTMLLNLADGLPCIKCGHKPNEHDDPSGMGGGVYAQDYCGRRYFLGLGCPVLPKPAYQSFECWRQTRAWEVEGSYAFWTEAARCWYCGKQTKAMIWNGPLGLIRICPACELDIRESNHEQTD